MPSTPRLLLISEVAEMCRVPISTVEDWMDKKLIPYIQLFKHCVRFRYDDVIAFRDRIKYIEDPCQNS